ncbi:MAG: AraC family transcriptional regulator [Pseudomonadota bacterium]
MRFDIDTFHDVARPFFEVKLLTERESFHGEVDFFSRGDVLATSVAFSDQRHCRDPRRVTETDPDIVLVETYYSGSSHGLLADQSTCSECGSVHIMDWSRPYVGIVSNGARGVGLQLPHAILGFDPSRHTPYRSLPPKSAQGRLLSASLHLLIEELSSGETEETDDMIQTIVGLVRTCVIGDASWDTGPVQDAGRRALVERHIRRNLSVAPLTVSSICKELGMSRATLYRCFGQGGIERFVSELLLDRCLDDLLASSAESGAVRRVAERWGFFDPGNFRKRFRARFGFSPSDCLGEAPLSASGCAPRNVVGSA